MLGKRNRVKCYYSGRLCGRNGGKTLGQVSRQKQRGNGRNSRMLQNTQVSCLMDSQFQVSPYAKGLKLLVSFLWSFVSLVNAILCFCWEQIQHPLDTTTPLLTLLGADPSRCSPHPGSCYACCDSRIFFPQHPQFPSPSPGRATRSCCPAPPWLYWVTWIVGARC